MEEAFNIIKELKERRECGECTEIFDKIVSKDCDECGKGVENKELAMVGMDAVALFPSLTGKRTASIVKRRTATSNIRVKGFNWKRGAIYIKINRHLVKNISKEVRKFIPIRKKSQGTAPGMASKGLKNKEGN